MFTLTELEDALPIVRAGVPATPQYAWPLLKVRSGANVIVKHENHTPTGAFKVRGGLTYFDRLRRAKPQARGVVAATRGNHGQSLAFAGARAQMPVIIVVPRGNSVEKNAAMRAFGAELVEYGRDFDEAKDHAQQVAAERGYEFGPSFHVDLVVGVATCGYELLTAFPDLETVYVPTNSAMTFADGMAVRVPDPAALDIMRRGVERIVEVSEAEIAEAIRNLFSDTHNVAEGAGAAPFAALMKERGRLQGRQAGVVVTGQNIDRSVMQSVLAGNTPQVEP